jgi:signal peptidase II
VSSRAAGWARAVATLVVVVGADQLTKAIVRDSIARGDSRRLIPGVDLVHVRNDGVAFGLLGGGGVALAVLTGVALVVLLAYFWANSARPWAWLPTGLLLGGALGNLVDRLAEGAVTDFVDLPLWPAFNLADVAITVGVVALLLVLDASGRQEAPARS